MFFGIKENSEALGRFLTNAKLVMSAAGEMGSRVSLSSQIIQLIHQNPKDWDERCSFNIKFVGDQFLSCLQNFDIESTSDSDRIYVLSYRFLCEFDFFDADNEGNHELDAIKKQVLEDTDKFDRGLKSQIIYASYFMPANLTKDLINNSDIRAFKGFEEKIVEAKELRDKWDEEIDSKKLVIEKLKDNLNEYKIGFNFVGLYKGFAELADKKSEEALLLFWALIGMGLLIISPLIFEIVFAATEIYSGKSFGNEHFVILIPLISVEIIMLYFFRIILLNHRSVKAQILQIELRKTLCQFIQSYGDYSVDIKKQDSGALEKFESLIFSGILSDPGKLPSTFDGVEQIGNFIKNVKNS